MGGINVCHMAKKRTWGIIGGSAAVAVAISVAATIGLLGVPTPQASETPRISVEQGEVASTPIPVAPEVVSDEVAPVSSPPVPVGPVKCPAGTKAGQVDGAGNETNCQTTHNGQPCVEYNDANQCVAWYKP